MDNKETSDRVSGKPENDLCNKFNSVCGDVRSKVAKCAVYSSVAVAFAVSAGIAEDPFLMIPSFMFIWPICKSYEGVIDGLEELRGMYKDGLSQKNETLPVKDEADPPDFKPR